MGHMLHLQYHSTNFVVLSLYLESPLKTGSHTIFSIKIGCDFSLNHSNHISFTYAQPPRQTYSTQLSNMFDGPLISTYRAFTATPMHHTTLLHIGASHTWHSIVIPFPAKFTLSTTPTTTTTAHSHIPDQHLTTISHPANAHGQFSARLACEFVVKCI